MRSPSKALPLYVQIAEGLIDRIEANELSPGEKLPPEREFAQSLGVTRITLRRALQILASEGLIERRQGAGNFIAAPKLERTTTQLNGFTLGMKQRGLSPTAVVVLFEKRIANISLAEKLQIPVSTDLYYCHRVRSVKHQPTMLEKFYLPATYFPGFDQLDLTDASVFEQLEKHHGVMIKRAEHSLEAVAASEYEAAHLEVEQGTPLLLERRIAYDQHNRPVEYAKDLYRGDRFKFLLTTTAN